MSDSDKVKKNRVTNLSTTDMKVYRREYYRRRYHEDEAYRKDKQIYNKKYCPNKTIRCTKCYKRIKYETLENMEYDKNNFRCVDCLPDVT